MSPRVVRGTVMAICAVGIAGMVAGSVGDDNAMALTFGLITAAAVACLIVATAVAGAVSSPLADDARGDRVEELIAQLVAAGADEATVRELVGEAARLGHGERPPDARAGAGVHGGRTPRPDPRTFT